MHVKNLSTDEFRVLVQEAVEQALLELLGDPDDGLVLRDEVRDRLTRSLAAVAAGERGTPDEDVREELQLGQ